MAIERADQVDQATSAAGWRSLGTWPTKIVMMQWAAFWEAHGPQH